LRTINATVNNPVNPIPELDEDEEVLITIMILGLLPGEKDSMNK
jgi:hypothetical protein